jgi:hypothetical protein
MLRVLPYWLVSRALALVFLVAAGLKVFGLTIDPVDTIAILSRVEVQVGIIELEILLALWLLWGVNPVGSWLASITAFGCFGAVSLYLGFIGQGSCGCAGPLRVNPWVAFSIDVIGLALLLLGRPVLAENREKLRAACARAGISVLWSCAGILLISGALFGLCFAIFGSTEAAVIYLRGDGVSLRPRVLDVGHGTTREKRKGELIVANNTQHPVCVLGFAADCPCSVVEELPLVIPPAEARGITVVVTFPSRPGAFARRARLFTDNSGESKIPFRLRGRAIPSEGLRVAETH